MRSEASVSKRRACGLIQMHRATSAIGSAGAMLYSVTDLNEEDTLSSPFTWPYR